MQQVSLTGHRVQPAAPHCFNLVVDGAHHGMCLLARLTLAPGLGQALMVKVDMASLPPHVIVVLPVHGDVQLERGMV